jgi:hypothetical protein
LVHLRRAWDTMAHTLGGEQHLCRALGPGITGVDMLHTADPKVQKRICECMHELEFDAMTDANSVGEIGGPPSIEDAIRVKSCSAEGSAWLRCVPHRRELWMANNAFVHAVNFRFGVPQRFLQVVDRCPCHDRYDHHRAHAHRHGTGQNHSNRGRRQRAKRRKQRHMWHAVKDKPPPGRVDGRGHHFLQCNTVEKLTKHNRIQSAVKRVGEDAGLTGQRAVPQDLRAGSNDRGMQVPDLKFYDYGPDMVDLLVDITQLHPNAPSYITKFGRSEAGSVANYGGNEKVRKHGDKAKASGHAFTGASLETYGIFGDDLRKLIKDFAKCGGDRRFSAGPNGWSAPNFIELSRQRIAVAAQIGLYNMMAKAQRARNTRRRGVASVLACLDPNIAELSSLVSLHHVASRDSSD